MRLLFLPFLTCGLLLLGHCFAEENTKLLFVQILFRHGDRSPIDLYPNDPNPASVWPDGLGELSILGKKQHYALGKYFHSMYENFTTFSPLEVDVISSDSDRCLNSAATDLASFFVPNSEWTFEEQFKWQPIPIHYIPKIQDRYLKEDSYCPRADAEDERVRNSPEGQRFINEHMEMFQNLTFLSGYPIVDWKTASDFRDVIFIEKKYNLSTPSWVEPYWEELCNVSDLSFFWSFNSPLLHRLRGGPLIQRIIEIMNNKTNGNLPDLKFKIYSAHDTTIVMVLSALNLYNFKSPPYCATLLIELHEKTDGQKVVRLLYMNSTEPENKIDPPHILTLEGCTEFCPLDYFINYTRDLILEDWDQECELDKSLVDKITEKKVAIGWIFILTAVIIVAISLYALWRMYSRRQDKEFVSAVNYKSLE